MEPDQGVGDAGAPRDEADSGPPGQLAIGLRHVGGAPFLPADDQPDAVLDLAKRLNRAEKTLPGHAEHEARAVADEIVDQNASAASLSHFASLRPPRPQKVAALNRSDIAPA